MSKDRWRWDWICSWWYRSTETKFEVWINGKVSSALRRSHVTLR